MEKKSDCRDILLIRHSYDDHSYIDGQNDTSLTVEGIDMARRMARNLVVCLANDGCGVIDIHSSNKKRSAETAEILSEEFTDKNIPLTYNVDENLRELYQGKITNVDELSYQEKVELLQLAWEIFNEKRVRNDLNYHFGDPSPNDSLAGFIDFPYGESQNEFSYRFGSTLRDIVQDVIYSNSLPIIITHRGGIREIQNLLYSINNSVCFEQSQVCEMTGLKYCGITTDKILDAEFCVNAMGKHLRSLRSKLYENCDQSA